MTNPNVHDSKKPILESEKPRMANQLHTLTRLEDCDIATLNSNVPENIIRLLES